MYNGQIFVILYMFVFTSKADKWWLQYAKPAEPENIIRPKSVHFGAESFLKKTFHPVSYDFAIFFIDFHKENL